MSRKGRRLFLISLVVAIVGVAVGLTLFALRGDVSLFVTPSELAAKDPPPGSALRIGGLVADGSVVHTAGGRVTFDVTDMKKSVKVTYTGILPDLFREGQGVVAEGVLVSPGQIQADIVLAKHDERYMPKDIADALKKQGVWQEDGATPSAVARSAE
jgi:cytochrome c-type biogenesis protein CcmE